MSLSRFVDAPLPATPPPRCRVRVAQAEVDARRKCVRIGPARTEVDPLAGRGRPPPGGVGRALHDHVAADDRGQRDVRDPDLGKAHRGQKQDGGKGTSRASLVYWASLEAKTAPIAHGPAAQRGRNRSCGGVGLGLVWWCDALCGARRGTALVSGAKSIMFLMGGQGLAVLGRSRPCRAVEPGVRWT